MLCISPYFFFNKAISQDTLNVVTQNIQNFDLANDKRILFDWNSKIYNNFSDAGFLLGVSIKPADKLTSLYYKFNLKNDTLVNIGNSKKFDNPFSKPEIKFIHKNESSIVSIVPKNNSRVYICYSKKKNTFSFIRFVTK